MKLTSLAQANEALQPFIHDRHTVDWTFALADMQTMMAALGNPQERLKIIHVAGSSGKTSTSYYIARLLRLSGQSVGLTVSPHVDELNERVQINGLPLPEAEFCALLSQFLDLPAVKAASPSYFGLLVAFAYWVFAAKKVDYAVIEVGLGGRLDATNVVGRPDKVCVITDIGLDHTDLLGQTLPAIAGEKAGIIQAKNVVFAAHQDEPVLNVLRLAAQAKQATLMVLPLENLAQAPQALPLFQRRNWALAKYVFDYVVQRDGLPPLSAADAQRSMTMPVPGRMELFALGDKTIITDGAHSAPKISGLCSSLRAQYPKIDIAALVSFSEGRDTALEDSMQELAETVDSLIITTFTVAQDTYKQAIDPQQVAHSATQAGLQPLVIDDFAEAFKALLKRPEPVLLITGSLYLLSVIRPLIKERLKS